MVKYNLVTSKFSLLGTSFSSIVSVAAVSYFDFMIIWKFTSNKSITTKILKLHCVDCSMVQFDEF